ncbi:MAG: class II aldolase/adducin family protein [Sphingomonadaceae bacterium]
MATAVDAAKVDEDTVWQARCELAACYRLCALFGWDDHVATHASYRLPDGTFLLNPFNLMFEEITASNLIRVDIEGNVIEPEDGQMNPAAYTVHSAVLDGRPDVNAAIHLHTRDGMAVSAHKDGLLPLTQTAMLIHHDIAYHEFEGIVFDPAERERLQADLGEKNVLILRNHGTLTCGQSMAAAFGRMFILESACAAQIAAMSMGDVHMPKPDVIAHMNETMSNPWAEQFTMMTMWPAMLRKAQRECPGFDQ